MPGDREWAVACQEFVGDEPEGVEVRPLVHLHRAARHGFPELFRGHVRERPADHLAGPAGVVGQVEVEEHRLAGIGEQHIARLDVQVQDAAAVGVVQPGRQVGQQPESPRDVGRRPGLGPSLGDLIRQSPPAQERHADEFVPAVLVDGVDRDDVRVLEPTQPLGLRGPDGGNFQHHPPPREGRLFRQEHLGEPAHAQLLDEREPQEFVAGAESKRGLFREVRDRVGTGRPDGLGGPRVNGPGGLLDLDANGRDGLEVGRIGARQDGTDMTGAARLARVHRKPDSFKSLQQRQAR